MTKLHTLLQDASEAILAFVVQDIATPVFSQLPEEVDLEKNQLPMPFPYGTACAIKIRLTSLILGTQYRFMPQLSSVSCKLSLLFKALAECRNWMPRELVCGDSWSKTLRFP